MKMRYKKAKILGVVVLTLILCACKEEDKIPDTSFIVHDWKVVGIILPGSNQLQPPRVSYVFNFNSKKEFVFQAEVNSCGGVYDIPEGGKINIDWHGCEKVCCDSNYAENMKDIVSALTNYKIKNDTLTLIGSGQIILRQKKNVTPDDIAFIAHNWKVLSVTHPGANQPETSPVPYFFQFNDNGEFGFLAEVNSCGGLFNIPEPGKISITWHGCTKVCCDSKYADSMKDVIYSLTNYEVKNDTLTLIGSGRVRLKKL